MFKNFALTMILVIFLCACQTADAITFNDGTRHVIDATNSFPFEDVVVTETPFADAKPTTVELVPGGVIGTQVDGALRMGGLSDGGSDTSIGKLSGGTAEKVLAFGRTTVTISASTVVNDFVRSFDTSHVSISGGSVGSFRFGAPIDALGGSTITILGGSIDGTGRPCPSGGCGAILARNHSLIRVLGGTILGDLTATEDGRLEISGGSLGANAHLFALQTSKVTILGTEFNLPFGAVTASSGTLIGTLLDGSSLYLPFGRASTAAIVLIPEPAAALLMMVGLIGLAFRVHTTRRTLKNRSFLSIAIFGAPRSSCVLGGTACGATARGHSRQLAEERCSRGSDRNGHQRPRYSRDRSRWSSPCT